VLEVARGGVGEEPLKDFLVGIFLALKVGVLTSLDRFLIECHKLGRGI
jgi:hypothetical protein